MGNKVKIVKRHLVLGIVLAMLVLFCGMQAIAYSRTDRELKQLREGLQSVYQMKLNQRWQVNQEINVLRDKINKTETELKKLEELTSGIKSVSRMTTEEMAASFSISGVRNQLTELLKQEQVLLAEQATIDEQIKQLEMMLGKR